MGDYWCYTFWKDGYDSDLILGLVGHLSFDTFEEEGDVLKAYIPNEYCDDLFQDSLNIILDEYQISKNKTFIPNQNWNQNWENQFSPIFIEDQIAISSGDESYSSYPIHILINPNMTFGTGHHQTTHLMLKTMLDITWEGTSVLDFGCGTGILGIFAAMRLADKILALDIDERSLVNTKENFELNKIPSKYEVKNEKLESLEGNSFDAILANINTNTLLENTNNFKRILKSNGRLLLSGFLISDEKKITEHFQKSGFQIKNQTVLDDWICLLLVKDQ